MSSTETIYQSDPAQAEVDLDDAAYHHGWEAAAGVTEGGGAEAAGAGVRGTEARGTGVGDAEVRGAEGEAEVRGAEAGGAEAAGAGFRGAVGEARGGGARWHAVCPLTELEPMWGEAALIDGLQIALVRLTDDRVFAVDHWDPYAKANVMARGIVGSKGGRPTLASPIHKQVYDLKTGTCYSEDGLSLRTYPVRIDEGTLYVQV